MLLPSCEESVKRQSVLDYGFTDLNMRLGVMNLTHHMLNVEPVCSSAVKATLDSGCKLILVPTDTDPTVLLIGKLWLQAAILVMPSSETAVRQLQCERSDETLVRHYSTRPTSTPHENTIYLQQDVKARTSYTAAVQGLNIEILPPEGDIKHHQMRVGNRHEPQTGDDVTKIPL